MNENEKISENNNGFSEGTDENISEVHSGDFIYSVSGSDVPFDIGNGEFNPTATYTTGAEFPTVSANDYLYSDSGNLHEETATAPDYSGQLTEIHDGLTALNAVNVVIFLFLILSWTEKKISHSVHNFTNN